MYLNLNTSKHHTGTRCDRNPIKTGNFFLLVWPVNVGVKAQSRSAVVAAELIVTLRSRPAKQITNTFSELIYRGASPCGILNLTWEVSVKNVRDCVCKRHTFVACGY